MRGYTEAFWMATARVFKSGNSQAVRLPKEFRFRSKEVEIFRRGDEVILREKPKGMARALELIERLPIEDLADERDESPREPDVL
jgi:antitoxin VapB